MLNNNIPSIQNAVQLIAPNKLLFNKTKKVILPGPTQVLVKVECVGLCFSDMKLIKQFDQHARKGKVKSGIENAILKEIPSYVPEDQPTVPGHETCGRIVAIGDKVLRHKVGERILVETDYRTLLTNNSNAAFGYNFEGGLQEFVLFDERIVLDPENGERFLIPVSESPSSSAISLIEPWACVEDSYISVERNCPKLEGRLLIVVAAEVSSNPSGIQYLKTFKSSYLTTICANEAQYNYLINENLIPPTPFSKPPELSCLPNEWFDDIVYFGSTKEEIEILNDKLAPKGLFNVVLCGRRIRAPVSISVGRVHYGMTRWSGTITSDCSESYKHIPHTGEIRPNDSIVVIGAAGPMGQMHVLRCLCSTMPGISVTGTDIDQSRISQLKSKATDLALKNNVPLFLGAPSEIANTRFSYHCIMVPSAPLVAAAIQDGVDNSIINIFAGIPATVKELLNLDSYVEHKMYMFGTSGSTIEDMKIVLNKVVTMSLDPNISVAAISGLQGSCNGIAAVEARSIAGKIMVYPWLDAGLILLHELETSLPSVAAKLDRGKWTKAAEEELKLIGKFV